MNKMKTINIALIGYGFVGKTFHAPLIQSVDGLTLAVVSSRDEEKVKRDLPDVQVVATPEEAITHPDIDLVVIASPNATHAPLATLALNAGKHVVVDKPFTLNMQEARDLIALADEKQLLLSVFHNRRWDFSLFIGGWTAGEIDAYEIIKDQRRRGLRKLFKPGEMGHFLRGKDLTQFFPCKHIKLTHNHAGGDEPPHCEG